MSLVIHVGMHKTGSTSIQNTLKGLSNEHLEYIDWKNPNHSPLFALMFFDKPENYHLFRKRGLSHEDLMRLRVTETVALTEKLSKSSKKFIFSGEDLSNALPKYIEKFSKFLSSITDDI